MTIVHSQYTGSSNEQVVHTFGNFRETLGVDWDEIVDALPQDVCNEILTRYELQNTRNRTSKDTVRRIDDEKVQTKVLTALNATNLMLAILESRPERYVYVYDGCKNHRIIEIAESAGTPQTQDGYDSIFHANLSESFLEH